MATLSKHTFCYNTIQTIQSQFGVLGIRELYISHAKRSSTTVVLKVGHIAKGRPGEDTERDIIQEVLVNALVSQKSRAPSDQKPATKPARKKARVYALFPRVMVVLVRSNNAGVGGSLSYFDRRFTSQRAYGLKYRLFQATSTELQEKEKTSPTAPPARKDLITYFEVRWHHLIVQVGDNKSVSIRRRLRR